MADYTRHSKFAYKSYDEITDCLNRGELDAYDIVYTKDTHENIIIAPDYSIVPIKSKVYRFLDTKSAEDFLNKSPDTYDGQIISIVHNGAYVAYIVNQNQYGKYYVVPVSIYNGEVDYDTLGHRPIINLDGSIGNPIIVSNLDDGVYKINGQYKISKNDATTYLSGNSNLFLVEHGKTELYIKRISAKEIYDFIVRDQNVLQSTTTLTKDYLDKQGYASQTYVDQKIAALDYITQAEVNEYVADIVNKYLDAVLDEKIDNVFEMKLGSIDDKDIIDLFEEK